MAKISLDTFSPATSQYNQCNLWIKATSTFQHSELKRTLEKFALSTLTRKVPLSIFHQVALTSWRLITSTFLPTKLILMIYSRTFSKRKLLIWQNRVPLSSITHQMILRCKEKKLLTLIWLSQKLALLRLRKPGMFSNLRKPFPKVQKEIWTVVWLELRRLSHNLVHSNLQLIQRNYRFLVDIWISLVVNYNLRDLMKLPLLDLVHLSQNKGTYF